MATTRIGFISASGAQSPHFEPFRALVPAGIEFDFQGLGLDRERRYIPEARAEAILAAARAIEERGCQAVVVSGAPAETMTPDLSDRLRAAVRIPSATAMGSSVAALQALGATRVALLTPFDAETNEKILAHLARRGIIATPPPATFNDTEDAVAVPPEEVYERTKDALQVAGPVDAIYFQGAVLDPLAVMDRLETDFGLPVVASNPAMLWYSTRQLGQTHTIAGHGRLLREWPAAPATA